MDLFHRPFRKKYREETATAKRLIEGALRRAEEPIGGAESAMLGAEIRQRVFSVIEAVESEIGQHAVVIAQDTGVLMVHPQLTEAFKKVPGGDLIEHSFYLCFPTPAASQVVNKDWPSWVQAYKSRPNTL
ncbi:MAG: hypothetical protein ACREFA_13005, partial [Stellaceae bacterium]